MNPKLNLKRLLGSLGFDGWALGLTGFVAIIIGLLDFTPLVNLNTNSMLRIIVVASGLLLGAAVAQTSRRTLEIKELRDALGLVEVKTFESKKSLPQYLAESVHGVQDFVLDTNLNEEVPVAIGETQELYRRILDERTKKGEIDFRKVEVIFTKQRLESVIRRLLMHQGQHYFIRHYYSPSKAIPALHIMSFDGKGYILGGFYSAGTAGVSDQERYIYIRQPDVNHFLREYWDILWRGSIPLNAGGQIDWKELEQIAIHINISTAEFQEMVTKIKNEVQRSDGKRKREVKGKGL